MSVNQDQVYGYALLVTVLSLYAYWLFWTLVTPFIEEGHFVLNWFLPLHFAISIPMLPILIILCLIITFLSFVMIESMQY
ncbi:hypothetical protein PROFUN_03671 [Planoprotostelium fungivorum]|uniref:Dolichol phosphate-mannose biosynthesis regulatory protein n=1 Tax=Planoprotostelium fungivorum TaxID=1890364 RepID=A0A2P6NSH9_9EUKA|nr:hypothetical protein PROFUN_03671 [Planoprotostelium fungivorum]